MDKTVIRSAYRKIRTDDAFRQETVGLLRHKAAERQRSRAVPVVAVAAALVVAVPVAALRIFHWGTVAASASSSQGTALNGTQSGGGASLPAVKPPEGAAAADMSLVVVHDGMVYKQCGTTISDKDAVKLLGKKLGTANGKLSEFSQKNEYQTELASDFTGEIYTVKGYDSGFRLIGIEKDADGETKYARILEHWDEAAVRSGTDVFGKLKLRGTMTGITAFDWRAGEPVCGTGLYAVGSEPLAERFTDALCAAKPFRPDDVPGYDPKRLKKEGKGENDVSATVVLKDGSHVSLMLRKLEGGGYVSYPGCSLWFKIPDDVFGAVWNRLCLPTASSAP